MKKTAMLVGAVILLAGCSVKFVYNQLDWLVPWYLDDYVTMDSSQVQLLEERLDQYLRWHRREQLPRYADFLDETARLAEDGLGRTEMDAIFSQAQTFLDMLLVELSGPLADLMRYMSDDQVEELMANLQRRNRDYRKRYVDTAELAQRDRRAEGMQKMAERWIGELDSRQTARIELWSLKYHLLGAAFLETRQDWQEQLRKLLQQRDMPQGSREDLAGLLARRPRPTSGEARRKYDENIELLKQLYLDLDASLSSYQRNKLVAGLTSYADDFRELVVTE